MIGSFDEASVDAIESRVRLDDYSASLGGQWDRVWAYSELRYGFYRGGAANERLSGLAQGLYRLAGQARRGLSAGYQFYAMDALHPSPLYFSPRGYVSHGLLTRLEWPLTTAIKATITNNLFYQPGDGQVGESPHAALTAEWAGLRAALEGYYLVSRLRGSGRFISRHIVAGVGYRF